MSHAVPAGDGVSMADKQRTVLISLIIDFILWIPDVVAAILSMSIVLFADAVKCLNEIIATFFAYLTIRKMAKGGAGAYDYGMGKFETVTSIITGGVMLISLALVFFVAIYRIAIPESIVHEGAYLGIILMIIGVTMNTFLWKKNFRLYEKEPSPIMDSQWRLFRTKAFSDFAVLLSLIFSLAFSHYAWWPIVEWTDTNSFGVYLAIGYTQSYALEANLIDTLGGSHFIRSSPQTVYSGWQHFGLTYDKASGIASLYKGGSLVATTNVGSFTPRTDTGMLIGYHPRYTGSPVYGAPPTSERMLQGGIDELAIYRRALGAAEIQQLSRLRPERCSDYPPEIGRQPQGTIVVEGGAVSFAVSAGGSQLLRFQWHHNGMPLAGAEDEVLSLTDVALSGAGDYSVIVANAFGAVTSRVARLEVLPTGQSLAVPSGAVAWWRGEGNGWDELGRSDAVWGVNMTPEYSAGIAGSAFHHNGSSTYLQVAANTNLDVGRGPGFTVEGWINPEAPSVGSVVDWNDVRGNVGVGIMINRTGLGTIEATLTDTNGIYSNERMVTFASALYAVASPTNQLPGWTHVALTFDKASSKATLLVNGLVVASRNLPAIRTVASPQFPVAFTPTTSGNLYFGYRPSGYNSWGAVSRRYGRVRCL